jgi:hypothetical protein
MGNQFNFTTEIIESLEQEDFVMLYDDKTGKPYMVHFSTFIASVQTAIDDKIYLTIND